MFEVISLLDDLIFTTLKGSVGSIVASLRHMAKCHFISCSSAPLQLKATMAQLTDKAHQRPLNQFDGLEKYCVDLCNRVGIENRYPPRSGLTIEMHGSSGKRTSDEAKVLQFEKHSSAVKDMHSSKDRKSLNSSMRFCEQIPSDFESTSKRASPSLSPVAVDGGRDVDNIESNQGRGHYQKKQHVCNFVPVQRGVWHCHLCLSESYGIPSAIWRGNEPPSASFIERHHKECPVCCVSPTPREEKSHRPILANDYVSNQETNTAYSGEDAARDGLDSTKLVLQEDNKLLTDHTIFVLQQLGICHFTGAGDANKRYEMLPVGFPGVQCNYCQGRKGARRFFWSNPDRFKNNSSEFAKHLLKCKYCPDAVKKHITYLKSIHPNQIRKLPRGSQIVFYRRMFRRLHGNKPIGNLTMDNLPKSPEREMAMVGDRKLSGDEMSLTSRALQIVSSSEQTADLRVPSPVCLGLAVDSDWLDDKECFLRQNIEVFCATPDDIETVLPRIQSQPPDVGQVGLRCIHCSRSRRCKGLTDLCAYTFPKSTSTIRNDIVALQEHLSSCPYAPQTCKSVFKSSPLSTFALKVTREYYKNAATRIGLNDGRSKVQASTLGEPPSFKDIATSPVSFIQSAIRESSIQGQFML